MRAKSCDLSLFIIYSRVVISTCREIAGFCCCFVVVVVVLSGYKIAEMTQIKKDDDKLHVVLFPWLAFGHMIPFLEFAKLIARKGHRVSFICPPRNVDRLPKPTPANLIDFVKLPLPRVDSLPKDAEATVDVPFDKIQHLKFAYDELREPVTRFLETSAADWILYDFAPYWVESVAARLGIKRAFLGVFSAAAICFMGPPSELMNDNEGRTKPVDLTVPPEWIPFPSTLAFRQFEIYRMADGLSANVSGVSDMYRFGATFEGCDIMAIRSCLDFEPQWFQLLEDIQHKPVLPVGFLSPPAPAQLYGDNIDDDELATATWKMMKEWLEKQKKGSVVYVAFGTEAKLRPEEITSIALGLEQSQLPFFWVLRNGSDQIPKGFEERTEGRGVVWNTWAPQLKILAHDSVGGYLAHSGWSSVIESVTFGKPMILLTFIADQGLNARVLEERKMGYCIPRNELDGYFSSDAVAESLRLVMVEDGGKVYRDKVKEMSVLFGDRDKQDRYLDSFLDHLKSHKTFKQ